VSARRASPNAIKLHYSYSVGELAALLGVHKNTIRNWQRTGLPALDGRPVLIHGAAARAFLVERNRGRKQPCPPGAIYCFRCKEPRPPALNMVELVNVKRGVGNLRALCGICGGLMHRKARRDALAAIMPGLAVQITEAS
jgi:hypothetical protein